MSIESSPIPASFGRYVRVEYVGEGGMSTVYKAFDTSLNREVALKFLRWSDPEAADRFLMEARSQARLEHEHICRVYEAGDWEGRQYIAMQFIRGKTLNKLIGELTLEQKIRLASQVAMAIHAAHRAGLIHRDLKPSNIMAELSEDGEWTPYVMDFGLVREVQAPGFTSTGVVVGSPWYMSPEQARGVVHTLDRRCDIYSLGATLYEVLSSRLPFEADSSVEVLVKLLSEEPVALSARDPSIPSDLNTIVMKCLEKDPARRYDSGKALAEDLIRYLDGDPIHAQAAGWLYRARKKAQKHKVVFSVIAVALTAILVISGWSLRTLWQAREQAALAQQFGQQAERIESIVSRGYLLPVHNINQERRLVQQKMKWIEQQMKQLGAVSRGPGHYALGRGFLALHDDESARVNLEKAWNEDAYRTPQVASALGQSLAALYQNKLDLAERIPNKSVREQKKKELEHDYRDPALSLIERGRSEDTEAPEYLEAQIAFLEKRYDDGLKKAQEAFAKHPWLYMAKRLEGSILLRQGFDAQNTGNLQQAELLYGKASTLFQQAADIGRSDSSVYHGQCSLGNRLMELEQTRGSSTVQKSFESALALCNLAITVDPMRADPYVTRSWVYLRWGEYLEGHGEDSRVALGNSITSSEQALKLNPLYDAAYDNMGLSYWRKGEYENDHGFDPRDSLDRSVQASLHATTINPNNPWLYNNMGLAYWTRAIYEGDHGGSPLPFLQNAVASYEKAIAINPQYFWPYNNMGNAYSRRSIYELRNGKDPRASQDKALEYYKKALQINPSMADAHNNTGTVFQLRATYEMQIGLDPDSSFHEALSCYSKASSLDPDYEWPWLNSAQCHQSLAQYRLEHKQDPATELEAGRAALQKAVAIHPGAAEMPTAQCAIEVVAARWAAKNHLPAEGLFQKAERYFQEAVKLDSNDPEIYATGADLYRRYAEWDVQQNKNPGPNVEQGLRATGKALSIDHDYSPALATQGAFCLINARYARSPDARKQEAQRARDALAKAIRQSPSLQNDFGPLLKEAESLL